jgi:hypothetical protein
LQTRLLEQLEATQLRLVRGQARKIQRRYGLVGPNYRLLFYDVSARFGNRLAGALPIRIGDDGIEREGVRGVADDDQAK